MRKVALKDYADAGDNILKNYLHNINEGSTFNEYKQWILDEIIDPYNLKLPYDLILEYYNYCMINFKK